VRTSSIFLIVTLRFAVTSQLLILGILEDSLTSTGQVLSMLTAGGDHALNLPNQVMISRLGLETAKEVLCSVSKEAYVCELVCRFVGDARLIGVSEVVVSLCGVVDLDHSVQGVILRSSFGLAGCLEDGVLSHRISRFCVACLVGSIFVSVSGSAGGRQCDWVVSGNNCRGGSDEWHTVIDHYAGDIHSSMIL
jgi:hypothetical protein